MKKALQVIAATMALGGGVLPDIRLSAKDKRDLGKRPQGTPPRSMTEEELEYYKRNKTLNGFKPQL